MRNVLVTGASGFIGRRLCQELLAAGCRVRGTSLRGADIPGLEMVKVDLAGDFSPDFLRDIDTVFHLAAKAHALAENPDSEAGYWSVNTDGTRRVLEAARQCGVRRFVFFSSVKAMSKDADAGAAGPPARALTEQDDIEPDTPYGKSKLQAEQLVLRGGHVPEPVALRLCMVYGPGAKGNVAKMIEAVRRRRFPPLPEVRNKRSIVHVQDVARAALLAARHPGAAGQMFILSDGQPCSTRQMYEMICHALGRKAPSWTMPAAALRGMAAAGDWLGRLRGRRFFFDSDALNKLTGSAWFSSEKIQRELGFTPEWTFEKALPFMVRDAGRAKRDDI